MVNFNKGSSTWGSYSSPNGTQKLQANINTTIIEPGQSAYCASPVKEFETFFASFPASNDHSVAALEQLQSGDPVRVKNHVASQFPGMVIEWVRVSWDGVIQPPVLLPAGVTYQLLNYRYEFLVTNKNPVTAQKSYSWKNHYATFITDQENLNLTCNTKNTTPLTHDMTFSPFVLPAIAIYIIVIAVVAIVVAAAVMFLTSAWQAWQIIRPALKSGADAVGQLGDQINNVFKKAGEILDNNPIAIPIVAVGIVAAGGIAVLLLLGVNLTAKSGKHSISAEGRSAGKTSTGANVSYGKAKAGITGAV